MLEGLCIFRIFCIPSRYQGDLSLTNYTLHYTPGSTPRSHCTKASVLQTNGAVSPGWTDDLLITNYPLAPPEQTQEDLSPQESEDLEVTWCKA